MSSTPSPGPDPRTRVIHLDAGQRRDRSMNIGTIVQIGFELPRAPFEALFSAHYPHIRSIARANAAPGLAIVAVHTSSRQLVARAWLAARADALAVAIVGRHSEADVLLDDPAIALRHLAVLVPRPRSWDAHALAYEIVDLRTGIAFRDERGHHLEAAWCDGPAMITCGAYALFLLQTGDPSDWPADARDAWSMLPERVMRDERAAEPDRWRRGAHREHAPRPRAVTAITSIPGLIGPEARLLAEGEEPSGRIRVHTALGVRSLAVGERALARGILLGRYARCDGADLFAEHHVSRAHLLIKRVDDRVTAIDTASSEGIYSDDRRVRSIDLDREHTVFIGARRGSIRWEPFHA